MSLQLPEGLAAAMQGGGMPQSMMQGDTEDQGQDPLQALQDAIHGIVAALTAAPDPQDTQDLTQAMLLMTRVQTRMMKGAGSPGGPGGPQAS